MSRVEIEQLGVAYGVTLVIDALSLTIEDGSFFTLLGPSGCGKTTLLRTLAGFISAASGRIRFGERDVTHLPAHHRDIGMVFQDYALFPDKTVFENVAYGLRARRVSDPDIHRRVGEQLERVGLSAFPQRRPAELSGGQRQRVALARALVIRPTLLLMDEPLSNLDAKLRVQVRETIGDLQREAGITTVFVTHDQEEALALSDRIGLMRQGRLEQVGSPEEIYRRPTSAYAADFVGGANTFDAALLGAAQKGDRVAASFADLSVKARASADLGPGKVKLIIRPEDIAMSEGSGGAENAFAGLVVARQYLGATTRYAVSLSEGFRLTVVRHGGDHGCFDVGQAVSLSLDPERTLAAPS